MSSTFSDTASGLQGDIDILREALLSMETRRDALLEQIEQEERGIIEDTISFAPPASTIADREQKRMQDIMMAYRLTGVTIFDPKDLEDRDPYLVNNDGAPKGPKQVGIRFETFANAKYHEPYYVILTKGSAGSTGRANNPDEERPNQDGALNAATLHITKHTIPYSIPLRELERRFLNRDMSTFTHKLSEYLQAHVAAREGTDRVMQE
ncbi:hypothetical protein BGZ68_000511 [Mortierella alpina]|nr:hypothetical protein BGZ68_000511 [Mortierella alpina]